MSDEHTAALTLEWLQAPLLGRPVRWPHVGRGPSATNNRARGGKEEACDLCALLSNVLNS
jgi:hypothetical protein